MTPFEESLRKMPMRKWACTDCQYLQRRPRNPEGGYRCSFFDSHPVPIRASLRMMDIDLTEKRIHGPFTDEPVVECPAFEERKNHD